MTSRFVDGASQRIGSASDVKGVQDWFRGYLAEKPEAKKPPKQPAQPSFAELVPQL